VRATTPLCDRGADCHGELYRDPTANGVKVRSWCTVCLRAPVTGKPFVPVRSLTDERLAHLPVWPSALDATSPCEACGTVAVLEVHHWAPRHLFGADADRWPTSRLCGVCHRRWHEVVTPKMGRR